MSTIEVLLHEERIIDPYAVRLLYTSVGWWPERTEEMIARLLENDIAVGAWDDGKLVGFARVISDRLSHAYVEDVMVHPSYQRRGVGKLVMNRLLEALAHIEIVTLFCKADLIPFYEEQDFRAFPSQQVLHRRKG